MKPQKQTEISKMVDLAEYKNCDEISGLLKSVEALRKIGVEYPKILFVDWTKNTVKVQLGAIN